MISDAGSWYLQDTGLWPDAESCGEECPNIWGAANSEFILLVGADRWTSLAGFWGPRSDLWNFSMIFSAFIGAMA